MTTAPNWICYIVIKGFKLRPKRERLEFLIEKPKFSNLFRSNSICTYRNLASLGLLHNKLRFQYSFRDIII